MIPNKNKIHCLDGIRIDKAVLGRGMEGTVYKAMLPTHTHSQNTNIALIVKRERYSDSMSTRALKQEIKFTSEFANLQPHGFMHFYGFRILRNNTTYTHTPPKGNVMNTHIATFLKKRAAWPHVIEKVYSFHEPIHGSARTVLIGLVPLVAKLAKAGYSHNDLHMGNIAAGPTILDYTTVSRKNIGHDYEMLIDMLWSMHRLWRFAVTKNHFSPIPWSEYKKRLRQVPECNEMKQIIARHRTEFKHTDVAMLSRVYFPNTHADIAFDGQVKRHIASEIFVRPEENFIDIYFACLDRNERRLLSLLRACRDP